MSINDVQNELNNIKSTNVTPNTDDDEKLVVTPNTDDEKLVVTPNTDDEKLVVVSNINSILKKNIINLESFVEGKVINMYARSWNKLEPKLKRTKMTEFLQALVDKNEFDIITFNTLIKLLHNKINFNRKLNVTYDPETCVITAFDYSIYL